MATRGREEEEEEVGNAKRAGERNSPILSEGQAGLVSACKLSNLKEITILTTF